MNENVCNDNRFNLIAKYKAKLIQATNIETSQDEMAVIDNILFRMWQMGWLDKLDAASPWHRVEDELPKDGEFGEIVLACNDVGTVNAAFLSSYGKWYAANNTMYDSWTWMPNVTHWMPFPEPPKEEV